MNTMIKSLFLVSLVAGCGVNSGANKNQKDNIPDPQNEIGNIDDGISVETFLVMPKYLPSKINADELRFEFQSNVAGSEFFCSLNQAKFAKCNAGNAAILNELVHGKGYRLAVKARTQAGKNDLTPLSLDFLIDKQFGQIIDTSPEAGEEALPLIPPFTMEELGNPNDQNILENRSIQVGGYTGVVVPEELTITSYSTTKTYSGVLRMIRLMEEHGGAAYQGVPCEQDWETLITLESGTRYCDATPSKNQVQAVIPSHMPWNHIEMVSGKGKDSDEKIMVAAFDDEIDPTETLLGINFICQGSLNRGKSNVPILNRAYKVAPEVEMLTWCNMRDNQGASWWLGTFDAPLSTTVAGSPRIRVIYSIKVERGIISGAQFANHVGGIITKIVVPLTSIEENSL